MPGEPIVVLHTALEYEIADNIQVAIEVLFFSLFSSWPGLFPSVSVGYILVSYFKYYLHSYCTHF